MGHGNLAVYQNFFDNAFTYEEAVDVLHILAAVAVIAPEDRGMLAVPGPVMVLEAVAWPGYPWSRWADRLTFTETYKKIKCVLLMFIFIKYIYSIQSRHLMSQIKRLFQQII